MATKYCRADGSASWANANGPESTASACCTLATASSNAAAGDLVYVSGLGGIYRVTFQPGTVGTSGSRITYRGTANVPVISGADIITGWTSYSGSVYQAAVTTEPEQVFIDGEYGDRKTSTGNCVNEYDWFWASNVLYLYAPGDPDGEYTVIEATQRENACLLPGSSMYTDFDGLTFAKAILGLHTIEGDEFTVKNCIAEWNWWHGLNTNGAAASANVIYEDNECRYNGVHGCSIQGNYQDCIVRRNKIHTNGVHQDFTFDQSSMRFQAGFKSYGAAIENLQIYENEVYDNHTNHQDVQAAAIWLDYVDPANNHDDPNIIRHNHVHDNVGTGVFLEMASQTNVFGNLIVDSGVTGSGGNWDGAGIVIDCRATYNSSRNKVYNNTIVGGYHGIMVLNYNEGGYGTISDNEVKNNIVSGSTSRALRCELGGANNGTNGSGNVYDYNCLGAEASGFIRWAGSNYSTYDAWLAASSQGDHNVESDPSFTDAGSGDYTLASDSPCIGAGANLGADYDDGLLPASTWPDGVLTGDRDDY